LLLTTQKNENTWLRFQNGSINKNHNTRLPIKSALLGNAYEVKYSFSDKYKASYYVLRMGPSPQDAFGCSRV